MYFREFIWLSSDYLSVNQNNLRDRKTHLKSRYIARKGSNQIEEYEKTHPDKNSEIFPLQN